MHDRRRSRDLIAQYASSHQHPVNRVCHAPGIPLIVISIVWMLASLLTRLDWRIGALLFGIGWAVQFLGHAFERKLPEFFHDWRFLFVGVRWWWAKVRGRV